MNGYEEKEYDDLAAACEQLEDEVKGMDAYKHMYYSAKCPKLKALAEAALASEREHAKNLAAWIHAHISSLV